MMLFMLFVDLFLGRKCFPFKERNFNEVSNIVQNNVPTCLSPIKHFNHLPPPLPTLSLSTAVLIKQAISLFLKLII